MTGRQQEIIRAALDGLAPRDIASELGVSASTVSSVLSRARTAGMDIPRRQAGRPAAPKATPVRPPRPAPRRTVLLAAAKGGATPRAIAEALGVSPAYVHSELSQARARGIDIPRAAAGRPPGK